MLEDIYHYRCLSGSLATSGQPNAAQLVAIAQAGFEVVINLALHDGPYALPDEDGIVRGLGMTYENLPVIWTRPTQADLHAFFDLMGRYAGRRLYVHCAANMRVSAFMMLYRVLRLGWALPDAMPDLLAIWQPDEIWQAFIDEALAEGAAL